MKAKPEPETILKQIADIQEMERGKLCQMRTGTHYNHQTWEKGRNVVRYVPRQRVANLQKAIAGYSKYIILTKAYADVVIHKTRLSQAAKPATLSTRKYPKSK